MCQEHNNKLVCPYIDYYTWAKLFKTNDVIS